MYSAGFLNKRVTILTRSESSTGSFGREGGQFVPTKTIWANVDWARGKKALQEGAIDAYDTYMVRCRYHSILPRECRISFDSRVFQIETFNADRQADETQITCVELQQ